VYTFQALKYLYLDRNKFGRCLKKSSQSGRCYLLWSKLPTFTVGPKWETDSVSASRPQKLFKSQYIVF
jgi:hypothetical protein